MLTDFAWAAGWGDDDGDGALVDIEAQVECNRFHGVVVRSSSEDESEPRPRPVRAVSSGSAGQGNPRIQ